MAFLRPKHLIPLTWRADGTLTAADDKYRLTIPFDCEIFYVDAWLGGAGGASGNTDFVLEDETTTAAGDANDGDLWTVASGVGRIANTEQFLHMDADDLDEGTLIAGRVVTLNVNAVTGDADETDLTVVAWVYPTEVY